jgi:hypothetical protein
MSDLNENTHPAVVGDRSTPVALDATRAIDPSSSPATGKTPTDRTAASVPADNAGFGKVGTPWPPLGPSPKPPGVTGELFCSVKGIIARQTCLSDDSAP